MDTKATVELVTTGFELASQILELVQNSNEALTAQEGDFKTLEMLIQTSADRLGTAISNATETILAKLETEKLEELQSRTRNLATLVRLRRPGEALHYAMQLRESVDYARNRLNEGKRLWLGPWLAGQAMVVAAMTYAGASSQEDRSAFAREIQWARFEVLEGAKKHLLACSRVPWMEIAAFTRGESVELLRRLPEIQASSVAPPSPHENTQAVDEEPLKGATGGGVDLIAAMAIASLSGHERVHLPPNIPERKLVAARESMIASVENEELIALIDTTVFGGGGDGVAILPSRLIFKELFQEPVSINYSELKQMVVRIVDTTIRLGPLHMNLLDKDLASRLGHFLQEIRQQ